MNIIETTINEEEKNPRKVLLYILASMGSDHKSTTLFIYLLEINLLLIN